MDPLRKGIAIGMLFGNGKEAELNDKEVEIDVGDILDALTGIFTYNPEDEDPQGDPPGPWDGYSLFTVDLTAVKQSLEDIVAALQQHDPDYDPDETPPEDAVEELENELEQCHDCKDEVIAEIRKFVPDYEVGEDGCPKDGVPQVYQAAIDEVIGGEDDDEAQEKINGEPPEGPDPTPENPQKIFKIENGRIVKKISWWWTDDWNPASPFTWWLLFRNFTVSITTYDEDYNPTTVSYPYYVGWVYDSAWEQEPDYGPDWRPTNKQALDNANWTMQYFNDNTDPTDPIFHLEWDNRSGWPGVSVRHQGFEY